MKLIAVAFLVCGVLCNSVPMMAERPVPFRELMQSASAQPAVPAKPDTSAYGQSAPSKKARTRKTERILGAVLLGTGVATIAATVVVVAAAGDGGHPGRVVAGFAGGCGLMGGGVALIDLGSH